MVYNYTQSFAPSVIQNGKTYNIFVLMFSGMDNLSYL